MKPMLKLTLIAALFSACGGKDEEPTSNYCQAVCDWAASCATDSWGADSSLAAECTAMLEAGDGACTAAVDKENYHIVNGCIDAVSSMSGDCSAFTGSFEEMGTALPPAECNDGSVSSDPVNSFVMAQHFFAESNEHLCTRIHEAAVTHLASCLVEQFGAAPNISDVDSYVRGHLDNQLEECLQFDRFRPEVDFNLENPTRSAARECVADFDSLNPCEAYVWGALGGACGEDVNPWGSPDDAKEFACRINVTTNLYVADQNGTTPVFPPNAGPVAGAPMDSPLCENTPTGL